MDEIYREQMLEHYRNPLNKRKILRASHRFSDSNPLCGDQVEFMIRADSDGKILDAGFEGKGCVISMASSDLLAEHLKGKNLDYVKKMTRDEMLDILQVHLTPARVKCAMLALTAAKKSLLEKEAAK